MPKILVVDDSSMDRKLAERLLRKIDGWEVETATDGLDALKKAESFNPTAVVTDLQMPEMNGLQLVQEMKSSHPKIPVIVMTSRGSETIAVEALQSGAASYVPKKQLHRLLIKTVSRILATAEEQRTLGELMRGLETISWEFTVNNDPSLLASLVGFLQSEISRTGLLPESDSFRCGVAFEEALLNAAYHGNLEVSSDLREENPEEFYDLARQRNDLEPYRDRKIKVEVNLNPTGIEYTIRDEGPGFDYSSVPDPTAPENLDRPCGRGLLLMKTFMDDVTFNEIGNCVTMIKRSSKTTSST
ncbi:response regulator [Thalassoglobus sp. JC818]|uniref:ATP-binding response regulator n=1 Tax=Thalassoglobus sp. JC818 TaxID=3232136 RepID=UPI003458DA54